MSARGSFVEPQSPFVNLPAGIREADQRSSALHLGIVRMRQKRQGHTAL
jgi:hypothetical protein